jgi:threonine dehydratase
VGASVPGGEGGYAPWVDSSPWPLAPADLEDARRRVEARVHRTPLFHSRLLDEMVGRPVWLKAESLQRSGSFKARGAFNAVVAGLEAGDRRGVLAVSSGNHGQAVALAARELGLVAAVVMPENSSPAKVTAVRAYGARVISEGVTGRNREQVAADLAAGDGLRLIHPHDDPLVMAGQSTVALELADQLAEVGARPVAILAPLGGGGLLAGICLGAASRLPGVQALGVEPENADDGARSFYSGQLVTLDEVPQTAADGVRTLHLGRRCWEVIRAQAGGVLTVSEAELAEAAYLLFTRVKLVVEPTGALALAALLRERQEIPAGAEVVCILSGGNCLPEQLAELTALRSRPA